MTRFVALDLSRLPPPQVIETLDFEVIRAELVADFNARWTALRVLDPDLPDIDVGRLETDPILAVAFQNFAYRELLLRARINAGARAVLLAYSSGADLDNVAANFAVARLVVSPANGDTPAVMESDARLRRRVQLAPDAYSCAGPADAYVFWALTAVPSLRDASAVQDAPGSVVVTIMKTLADPVPTEGQIIDVAATLNAKDVRPLTDAVSVQPPGVQSTTIVAELFLYPGPDASPVLADALARLAALVDANGYIGRDLRLSAIYAALHVAGVQRVNLISPTGDIVVGETGVVKVTSTSVTVAGRDT